MSVWTWSARQVPGPLDDLQLGALVEGHHRQRRRGTPHRSRCRARSVSTRVLPEPAGAMIRARTSGSATARLVAREVRVTDPPSSGSSAPTRSTRWGGSRLPQAAELVGRPQPKRAAVAPRLATPRRGRRPPRAGRGAELDGPVGGSQRGRAARVDGVAGEQLPCGLCEEVVLNGARRDRDVVDRGRRRLEPGAERVHDGRPGEEVAPDLIEEHRVAKSLLATATTGHDAHRLGIRAPVVTTSERPKASGPAATSHSSARCGTTPVGATGCAVRARHPAFRSRRAQLARGSLLASRFAVSKAAPTRALLHVPVRGGPPHAVALENYNLHEGPHPVNRRLVVHPRHATDRRNID